MALDGRGASLCPPDIGTPPYFGPVEKFVEGPPPAPEGPPPGLFLNTGGLTFGYASAFTFTLFGGGSFAILLK